MALIRKEEATSPGAQAPLGTPHTILGPEASFHGKLSFQGQVRIDGQFSGEIETEDLVVVGKGAKVEATLQVGSLVLHGTLRGDVQAEKSIELHPPARLYGNIQTPSLVVHAGVSFDGNCKMDNREPSKPQVLKDKGNGANKTQASAKS
jgi:cytoskeletal protein CcmA (bactofilin family)